MSNEITTVLDELRQDHRNMAVLLNYLEREAEKIFNGDDTDFELVHDIMQYMTVYPDAVHHPKEDRIYAELKAARPDLSQGMSRVTDEHRSIAEQSLSLRDKIEQVIAGDFVERNAVVADAMRYIEALRKHMRWEETDLFRRVDRMIADGHTLIDTSIMVSGDDPLFGARVEERFERLLESTRPAK
ncbi:MAG: hemerythrin domain-containing protein [Gammaproteobacteria bacterium]|nr:hemerythrin domain-containing protein [Gammaproteobacteria bacterium]